MGQLAELFELSRYRFHQLGALDPLCETLVTPQERFFVHHEGAIPSINPQDFRLSLHWNIDRSLSFSLGELQAYFPKVTILSTLKCDAGRCQPPADDDWSNPHRSSTGTAIWGGFQLLELLMAIEINQTAEYIAFTDLDESGDATPRSRFVSIMPLEAALRPEVLIAYEMNGEPLPPEHGAPLRLIVPGQAGSQSVKWLSEITLLPDVNFWW